MVNPRVKHNQALQDNLATVFPSNSDIVGGITIMYHQVANIHLPLSVQQGQYVYICN